MANTNGPCESQGIREFGIRDVLAIACILALLTFLVFATTGCAMLSHHNNLSIVNQTSYDLTVEQNGTALRWQTEDGETICRIRPSQSASVPVFRTSMFLVKAWNGSEFVGTTTFRKQGSLDNCYGYGYGYSGGPNELLGPSNPEVWVIRDEDFDQGSGGLRVWSQWLRQ